MHITPYILESHCDFKIADVVAILAYVGQIEFKWDSIYRRRVPSLEIGLMNFSVSANYNMRLSYASFCNSIVAMLLTFVFDYRRQIIFLCVREEHVGPNFWHLQCTDNLFEKFAVTYIEVNQRQCCLQTMRESTFFFSPSINDDHHHVQGRGCVLFYIYCQCFLTLILCQYYITLFFIVDIHEASLMTLDETRAHVNGVVQAMNI